MSLANWIKTKPLSLLWFRLVPSPWWSACGSHIRSAWPGVLHILDVSLFLHAWFNYWSAHQDTGPRGPDLRTTMISTWHYNMKIGPFHVHKHTWLETALSTYDDGSCGDADDATLRPHGWWAFYWCAMAHSPLSQKLCDLHRFCLCCCLLCVAHHFQVQWGWFPLQQGSNFFRFAGGYC